MSWRDDLRPASWRGVEFGVLDQGGKFGRDTEVHRYPFRNSVWVEDTGMATRKHGLRGFLVGDDVAAQLLAMIEAVEQEGAGELMHPVLGLRNCHCVDFEQSTRSDLGRVVEIRMAFVESGGDPLSGISTDFAGMVGKLSLDLDTASVGAFATSAGAALKQGAEVVRQAQSTVSAWVSKARNLTSTASTLVNSVGGLVPGLDRSLGRLLRGPRSPFGQVNGVLNTASGRIAQVGRARAAVVRSTGVVSRLVSGL